MQEQTIKIRNALPGDVPFLFNLFERSVRQTCHMHYSQEQIDAWVKMGHDTYRWESRISEQYFAVAEIPGCKFAGLSSLRSDGYLDLLFVDPDCQGKGVGKYLLNTMKKRLLDLGLHEMTTYASKTGRPFFESQGFRIICTNQEILFGVPLSNFYMKWIY